MTTNEKVTLVGCLMTILTALGMVVVLVPMVWARVAAIVTW